MVLILDGDSERVARTHEKKGLSGERKSDFWLLSIYSNALNRFNTGDRSLRSHLFLGHNIIQVPR